MPKPYSQAETTLRKKLMEEAGIKQSHLAEMWGVSTSTVSDIIRGKIRSYGREVELARVLSDKLGRSVDHLDIFPPPGTVRSRDLLPDPRDMPPLTLGGTKKPIGP